MPLLTAGAAASAAWLAARGLRAKPQHWYVELVLAGPNDTRFALTIYPEEWGVMLQSDVRVSLIRVTDIAFVHGRDDFALLGQLPALEEIGALIATSEQMLAVPFDRRGLAIRSNVSGVGAAVRSWLR